MSLPTEILDQLLSGYLDDVLSVDERARVEQLLKDDPTAQAKLDHLKEISVSLKEIDRSEKRRLDGGFADRVLKATVDQASSEGLNEEHPVMMLAQQPSVPDSVVAKKTSVIWKAAGGLAALAASIAVAVAVLTAPDNKNIAEVKPSDPKTDVVIADSRSNNTIEPDMAVDPNTPIENVEPVENIAVAPAIPKSEIVPGDPKVEPSKVAVANPEPKVDNQNAVDSNVITNGFVMVLNVKLTEVGHMEDAIGNALKEAKIDSIQTRQIDHGMVAFKKKLGDGMDGTKVLYLEGSARKLDNFSNRLYLDREGVGSIGFNMSFDAPLLNFVNSLKKIDATKIQHVAAWELSDNRGDAVDVLAGELSSRNFASVSRDKPNPALANVADGQDIPSRIFVIVR